jgi:hypothetical protein
VNAKIWRLISPAGQQYDATNLRLWCDRNEALFAPHTARAAYAGLRQVAASMRGMTKRRVGGWRGWTLAHTPELKS